MNLWEVGKIVRLNSSLLRSIRPFWLREKLYFHTIAATNLWPFGYEHSVPLVFGPTRLTSLQHSDYAHRQIAWLGFYELALTRLVAKLAREGGLLVDVGANIGYYTCLWGAIDSENRVMSFEASPRVLADLTTNVARAGLDEQVSIHGFAIGRQSGQLCFDPGPVEQSGQGGLVNEITPGSILVDVKPLDEVIPSDVNIKVLKVDTEGADTWVLQGAERLLAEKRIAHVFFEHNEWRMKMLGVQSDLAVRFLTRLGYRVYPLEGDRSGSEFHAVPL